MLFFNLSQSLQFATAIGDIGTPRVFPTNGVQSNYLLSEQAFDITAYGLKPFTYHSLFLENNDVTNWTKQEGSFLNSDQLLSDKDGRVTFKFYFTPGLVASTPVEKSSVYAQLIAGTKKLRLQNSDSTSFSEMQIYLPPYVREESKVTFKKIPSPSSSGSLNNTLNIQTMPTSSPTSAKTYFTPASYNMIQTFYADPEIVNNEKDISITSIDLFFKTKPNDMFNTSGKMKPSVSIAICDVQNDTPIITRCYTTSLTEKTYDEINSYSDASTAVSFSLPQPLKLATGSFYGIVIIFDDANYALWTNVTGHKLVGTNKASPGTNMVKDGKLYFRNNSSVFTAKTNEDLKFNINIAKHTTNSAVKVYVNDHYEFLTIANKSGSFIGGEYVYKNATPANGTIAITKGSNIVVGSGGTLFQQLSIGQSIVIGNSSVSQVGTVASISNNTYMELSSPLPFTDAATKYTVTAVGKVYYKDDVNNKIYLYGSNANGSINFAVNDFIIGEDSRATANIASIDAFSVDRVKVRGSVKSPSGASVNTSINLAALSGGSYAFSDTNAALVQINDVKVKNINAYDGYVLSRSAEIANPSLYIDSNLLVDKKSLKVAVNLQNANTNLHSAPSIEGNALDVRAIRNVISNTYTTTANGVVIDTEVAGNGSALCRHIGSKVTFAQDRFAEDIRVFMTAYRPLGTDIKVYARVHNSQDSDAFDDTPWTPLVYNTNPGHYSSTNDDTDFVEYELGFAPYSESANNLPGKFDVTYNNATIVASGVTPNTYVTTGDLVKVYSPLFPQNYVVAAVSAANTSTITLNSPVTSNNVVGTGLRVDRLKYKNTAFNNVNNYNIVRYYNSNMVELDTFDSMQIKIVLLADNAYLVPKVDAIQVIGVSA